MPEKGLDSLSLDAYVVENRKHWENLVQEFSTTATTESIEAFLDGETQLLPLERFC